MTQGWVVKFNHRPRSDVVIRNSRGVFERANNPPIVADSLSTNSRNPRGRTALWLGRRLGCLGAFFVNRGAPYFCPLFDLLVRMVLVGCNGELVLCNGTSNGVDFLLDDSVKGLPTFMTDGLVDEALVGSSTFIG